MELTKQVAASAAVADDAVAADRDIVQLQMRIEARSNMIRTLAWEKVPRSCVFL